MNVHFHCACNLRCFTKNSMAFVVRVVRQSLSHSYGEGCFLHVLFGHLSEIYIQCIICGLSFQLKRGDPVTEVEFDRSCVGCELRRIHRQADEVLRECIHVLTHLSLSG